MEEKLKDKEDKNFSENKSNIGENTDKELMKAQMQMHNKFNESSSVSSPFADLSRELRGWDDPVEDSNENLIDDRYNN